ncbi:MAG: hypothetical protein WC744_00455 [Patescibacteria group bacterium]|jgi:hypothetical protein
MVEKDFPAESQTGTGSIPPCVHEVEVSYLLGWACIFLCTPTNFSKAEACSFDTEKGTCTPNNYSPHQKIYEILPHILPRWNRGPKKIINHIL